MKTKPTTTRINALLKKAGYECRFVRGRGYYYLHNWGGGSSSLYIYRLEPEDFNIALAHVNEVLTNEGLKTI